MTQQRLPAAERRDHLLRAARQCFVTSGLDATTMRAIADAAGVNIALLYRHFDSKDELIEAAISEPLVAELDSVLVTAHGVPEYLGKPDVQRAIVEDLMERLLHTVAELTPSLGVILFSARGGTFFNACLAPAIDKLIDAADISRPQWKKPEVAPEVVADMLVGTCLMYGIRGMYAPSAMTPTEAARHVCDVLFDGVAAPH